MHLLLRLLLLCSAWAAACGAADDAPISVVDSLAGLFVLGGVQDDVGTGLRFTKDVLMLFHDGNNCEADFEGFNLTDFPKFHPEGYTLVAVDVQHAATDILDAFGISSSSMRSCPTAAVVKRRARADPLDFVVNEDGSSPTAMENFFVENQGLEIGIMNDMPYPVDIYYSWRDGPEVLNMRGVAAGSEQWISSFKTTLFRARHPETGELLAERRFFSSGLLSVREYACDVEHCGLDHRPDAPEEEVITKEERELMRQQDEFRLENNKLQAAALPKFTEVGFTKLRIPDDVWDLLVTYYNDNREFPRLEPWGKGNAYTNNIMAPSYMLTLPERGPMKPAIWAGLKPILEDWSGISLTPTACYGIRAYSGGSWLANHVDTRNTHVISAIMNIKQDVDEDWPLMIYDHAGKEYNITLAPRDLVLYESATCVHGRPSIFQGRYYANSFVHFKPEDDELWVSAS